MAAQIITDCGNFTLDFKQHGLCASPLFLQTLGPWFPNEMQNLLSSEKRTLDHWVLFLHSPGKTLLMLSLVQKWLGSPFPEDVCYDPWHRCFRVFCFVYVSVYVCRDWLFITERDWWILKRVTLKGRRYQQMASSILAFAVMAWRAPDSAPSTDHQWLCGYCLWFILFILRKSFGA